MTYGVKHKGKMFTIWQLVAIVFLFVLILTTFFTAHQKLPTPEAIKNATENSIDSFGAAYTVTRTYTSRQNVIVNNLWRSSTQLTGGGYSNCALSNGNVFCWGKGTSGQLGNSANSNSTSPVAVTRTLLNNQRMTMIAGGQSHMCAINSGLAACWGDNTYGQLGNNSTTASNVPVLVSTFSGSLTPHLISAGERNTCAVADSVAYCWGDNSKGQVGDNSTTQRRVPTAVKANAVADKLYSKAVVQIQTGSLFACALSGGAVYCWGDNTYGQLGNGNNTNSSVPVSVTTSGVLSGKTVTQISAGYSHACAIADGQAYCWGKNDSGQLGNNSTTNSNVPVTVSASGGYSSSTAVTNILSGGYAHTCMVADGLAYCWGKNDFGQLGNGTTTNSNVPVAVNSAGVLSGKGVSQLVGGDLYTCAVANGRAYCWGKNDFGQLGNGTTNNTSLPYRVNDSYY